MSEAIDNYAVSMCAQYSCFMPCLCRDNAHVNHQKAELELLEKKVKEVFHECVPRATEGKEAIDMLREIELRLEQLLGSLREMPAAKRAAAEKEKEEERRKQQREEKGRQKMREVLFDHQWLSSL